MTKKPERNRPAESREAVSCFRNKFLRTNVCEFLPAFDVDVFQQFNVHSVPPIRDEFQVGLRNDLVVDEKSGTRSLKNVRLN